MHRLLILILFVGTLSPTIAEQSDRDQLLLKFEESFNSLLKDNNAYQSRVAKECRQFPEGQIFPYTLVAIAYCHRIYENPKHQKEFLPKIEGLLYSGVSSVSQSLKNRGLMKLQSTHQQGCLLGNLAMALAAYRLAGGTDAKLVALNDHLAALLHREIKQTKGAPIYSYPNLIWPFDHAVALFAIHLHDRVLGTTLAQPLLKSQTTWILNKGLDKTTLLPCSQIGPGGTVIESRGCDLSWRLAIWREMDPIQSKLWHDIYSQRFWKVGMLSKGFREWDIAHPSPRTDFDTGPIIDGIGSTASVLGLCTTQAHGDQDKVNDLFTQTKLVANARKGKDAISMMIIKTLDESLLESGIATHPSYITGFLYGDVTAFYAASWAKYPKKPISH